MENSKVFARVSISDIVIPREDLNRLPNYVEIKDEDGKVITTPQLYLVTYENEDGEECESDGTPL